MPAEFLIPAAISLGSKLFGKDKKKKQGYTPPNQEMGHVRAATRSSSNVFKDTMKSVAGEGLGDYYSQSRKKK